MSRLQFLGQKPIFWYLNAMEILELDLFVIAGSASLVTNCCA